MTFENKLPNIFYATDNGGGGDNTQQPAEQTPAEAQTTDTKPEETKPAEPARTIPYDRFKQVNDDLKAFKETFETLGIGGVDGLKSLVEDYNARKQAEEEHKRGEMSEIERLQADLKAKEEAEQALAKQIEEIQAQAQQERITNAFIKAATAHNIAYIDDAIKLADLSAVKVADDGSIEGIDEVVKGLVETKPFLLKKAQTPIGEPSNSGKKDASDKTAEQLLEEAKQKALSTGRAEDRAAYAQLKRELGL